MDRRIKLLLASRNFAVRLLCLIFAACFAALAPSAPQDDKGITPGDYAGDQKCLSCHRTQNTFTQTAHHLTSRPPMKVSIAGTFNEGENILRTANPQLHYKMEAKSDGFYQTAVLGTPPDTPITVSQRFDLVVGSGRKGQTYLYWGEDDHLFELPVSYWTALGKWVNSPGFKDGQMNFGRPVTSRCLECHSSYFESTSRSGAVNRYNRANFILGISCARCHGPGIEHAANQLSHVKSSGQPIVNPAKLERTRQIELCALCHGGIGKGMAPPFSYIAGKPLSDYLQLRAPGPDEEVDVHGNQVALLERSRCFQSSTMTCSTCHNVHRPQRNAGAFSRSCLKCHKVESCGVFRKRGIQIASNCVDCHMPKLTSSAIISAVEGQKLQPQVRTHWIKVYPQGNKP